MHREYAFTLIDIMRGIKTMSLVTRLTGNQYAFLVELVLYSNEIVFKNPFDLTNAQACALSSTNTRQGINALRRSLAKKRVDGQWLLKVKPGKGWENRAATYEINLNFIASYNRSWREVTESLSTNNDRPIDRECSESMTESVPSVSHPKIRSEEIREETTTEGGSVDASLKTDDHTSDITRLQAVIMKKGWRINKDPPPSDCRRALEIHHDVNYLIEVVKHMPCPLKGNPTPSSVIGTMLRWAANPSWWKPKDEPVIVKEETLEEQLEFQKDCLVRFKADPDYKEGMEWETQYVGELTSKIKDLEDRINE